jgi:hypothetical protein
MGDSRLQSKFRPGDKVDVMANGTWSHGVVSAINFTLHNGSYVASYSIKCPDAEHNGVLDGKLRKPQYRLKTT